jgi:hypothetical protein
MLTNMRSVVTLLLVAAAPALAQAQSRTAPISTPRFGMTPVQNRSVSLPLVNTRQSWVVNRAAQAPRFVGVKRVLPSNRTVSRVSVRQLANARSNRGVGVAAKGVEGYLRVDSWVFDAEVDVYVDGAYVGTVSRGGYLRHYVGQTAAETTYLTARTRDGRTWSRDVDWATGSETYTWRIE